MSTITTILATDQITDSRAVINTNFSNLNTDKLEDITGEALSALSDVTITSIASGELLKWNGSAWINNTLAEAGISATGHTHTESDITDLSHDATAIQGATVTITAIASGEILKYNGSAWINNTLAEAGISATGHTHTESDITDLDHDATKIQGVSVTITSIASGEILKYNGSAWINNTLAEAGIAAASHNHNASDINAGTLTHERGGLEADVSAYAGYALISGGSTTEIKMDFTKTTAPGASDDTNAGWTVGSMWLDVTNDKAYICLDATASAAVWTEITQAGGGGSPGGANTQVQFNDSSSFGGDAGFTYNKTTDIATIGGAVLAKAAMALDVQNTSDAAANQVAFFRAGNRATPADGDTGYVSYGGDDSAGSQDEFLRFIWKMIDVTNTTKDGGFKIQAMVNDTLTDIMESFEKGILEFTAQSRGRAWRDTSAQSIPNATWTKIQFNAETYDKHGEWDTSTNYRFTAEQHGFYLVAGVSAWASNTTGVRYTSIYKNGTEFFRGRHETISSGFFQQICFAVVELDATDYVEMHVYQTSGGNLNNGYGTADLFLEVVKII